jgi:hypothetical protein
LGVTLTVVAVGFVALVRPVTPVYMAYSIVPCYALLVASGWLAFLRPRAFALPLGVAIALAMAAVVGVGVVHAMRAGGGRVDAPLLFDIVQKPAAELPPTDVWLPAIGVDPLGRALCADPAPVYGALGYALDVFYALPLRMHCAQAWNRFVDEAPGQMSNEAPRGRLGLALRRYRDLGIAPAQTVVGIGLDPVRRVIAAPPHRDLPRDATYPPHPYVDGAALTTEYAFDADAAELVVVANPRATWMPRWASTARCDGNAVDAATTDLVTHVYRCAGAGMHRWQVALTAADPRALEVVTFVPSR